MSLFITNARIFDGDRVLEARTVEIDGSRIVSLGRRPPTGAEFVDADDATLIPGLIDGHVHTSLDGLRLARIFGVTTELEMNGYWTAQQRAEIAANDEIADVRSALRALTAPGGHPHEFIAERNKDKSGGNGSAAPSVSTPEQAVAHVNSVVAQGADYIKVMIEEGTVLGHPGLPMISTQTLRAAVAQAHRLGKKVVAHALTLAATQQAIEVGVDGFAHLFIDQPHTEEIVAAIADAGIFVTPCLVISSALLGGTGGALADDPRVGPKLSPEWRDTLRGSFNTYPDGNLDDALASVAALREAGVDIIAGTDSFLMPLPAHGGSIHGASLHHELQLLTTAGLTPAEALRAATSTPARRFGLDDRGRIVPGARADLVLIDGDPTTRIEDSLSIRAIWRRGTRTAG
jgi:imidazolonepropionase-like amidohydrolase